MHDQFARQTAKHAHHRIAEITESLTRLEKTVARRSLFQHRCALCGDPCKRTARYCHAHSWAEGT